LRDIARFLGSSWSIVVPLVEAERGEFQKKTEVQFLITDVRNVNGEWIILSAGHTLNLVSQELEILHNAVDSRLIDFLVVDKVSDNYHPLIGVPLSRFCYELSKVLLEREE